MINANEPSSPTPREQQQKLLQTTDRGIGPSPEYMAMEQDALRDNPNAYMSAIAETRRAGIRPAGPYDSRETFDARAQAIMAANMRTA